VIDFSILLNGNLLYAEHPLSEIKNMVEKSYVPVLETIISEPAYRVTLNFTGFSLELLAGEHPDIYAGSPEAVSLIKEALSRGQVEVTGTSWAHMILPLAPLDLAVKDIKMYLKTVERVLDYHPTGFFPPELCISPMMPEMIKFHGYRWTYVDRALIGLTGENRLNAFNDFEPIPPSFNKKTAEVQFKGPLGQLRHARRMERDMRVMQDMAPIDWLGTEGETVPAFACEERWLAYVLICLARISIMNEKRLFKMLDRAAAGYRGFLLLYSDIEMFGYGGNVVKDGIPVDRFRAFLEHARKNPAINYRLPSDYIADDRGERQEVYLKSGSWSTEKDFKLWTDDPDNQVLNRTALEAYRAFTAGKGALGERDRESVLRDLLLAFNSDGRGWVPIPEHRLFCYNKALEVIRRMG
jgi:predicted glycosyl hydrolase (DUF1957 family)